MTRFFLLAIAVTAAAALPPAAAASIPAPDVPGAIAVTGDEKPFLAAHAEGVQIYACSSGAWALVAPRATLYGENDQVIASHFGGPTWQARDGSSVVGRRGRRRHGRRRDPVAPALPRVQLRRLRRRPPRPHHPHPADQHGRRAPPVRDRVRDGGQGGRDPLRGRLRVLEGVRLDRPPFNARSLRSLPAGRRQCRRGTLGAHESLTARAVW